MTENSSAIMDFLIYQHINASTNLSQVNAYWGRHTGLRKQEKWLCRLKQLKVNISHHSGPQWTSRYPRKHYVSRANEWKSIFISVYLQFFAIPQDIPPRLSCNVFTDVKYYCMFWNIDYSYSAQFWREQHSFYMKLKGRKNQTTAKSVNFLFEGLMSRSQPLMSLL